MGVVLVNTPLKEENLLKRLRSHEGNIGFDTEVVGPQLRGRDFVNITYSSLLGFSVALEGGKTYSVPVRHKGNNVSFLGMHKILKALQKQSFTWHVWAHNAKFDHQVLIREGYPMRLRDSMVAAWLATGKNTGLSLDALGHKGSPYDPTIAFKTGDQAKEYAGQDAVGTLEAGLDWVEASDPEWLKEECQFAKVLAEMKLQGMRLDKPRLREVREEAKGELHEILSAWREFAPDVSITSSTQLQELFEDGTWVAAGKTAGGAFSTAGKAMEYNV